MRKKTKNYSAEFKLNGVNRMARPWTISGLVMRDSRKMCPTR